MGLVVAIAFGITVFFVLQYRKKVNRAIQERRKTAIAISVGCNKNVRSSMTTVHYSFYYDGHKYTGETDFDPGRRGDICNDNKFLVEFDSLHPFYNQLLLDSIIQ